MSFFSSSMNASYDTSINPVNTQPQFDIENAINYLHTGDELKKAMKEFDSMLNSKALDLIQSISEKTKFVAFITSVQAAIEAIVSDSIQIDSVKQGCLSKMGNMIKGNNSAKLIIVLKTMPTLNTPEQLSALVQKNIQINFPTQSFFFEFDEYSFTIRTAPSLSVTCFITTLLDNFYSLDPKSHLPERTVFLAYEEGEISKYLEQKDLNAQVKSLIRSDLLEVKNYRA